MRCSYHKARGPLENCDHYDDIGVMCYMGEWSVCTAPTTLVTRVVKDFVNLQ